MIGDVKDAERLALLERARSIYHEACVMPRHITVEVIADHLAAAIAASCREERERAEYLAQRWKDIADSRYTIDDLAKHRDEGRDEARRDERALDEAVIVAARELLEVSGRSRQLAYSRERLQDALAARDAAVRERGGEG
jgi:hypothetical protein